MISDINMTSNGANQTHMFLDKYGDSTASPNRGSLLGGSGSNRLTTNAPNKINPTRINLL